MNLEAKNKWLIGTGILFILLNSIGIAFEFYWTPALPALALLTLLAMLKLDVLIIILVFLVPLSINIEDLVLGMGLSIPDEPLIIGIFLLVIFKFIIDGEYDFRVLKHPISIVILINLAWILITSFTSMEKIVSIKFFLSRSWFLMVFYFLAVVMFRKFEYIKYYIWAYIIPLGFVIIYTLYKHSFDNFSQVTSFEIMAPFYIAHGIYAAAIAFFIPLLFLFVVWGFRLKLSFATVLSSLFFLILLSSGLILSYTRAGWISLAAALFFGIALVLRLRLWHILGVVAIASIFVISNFDDIFFQLYQNKQNSAEGFEKHLESVSNVRNDVSNLERVNRWMAAINMVKEKPVFGFGPGAYSFTYAPFQDPEFQTPITTAFGDQGHAHSEYLNPLAESGWMGMISFILIIIVVFVKGLKLVYRGRTVNIRLFSAGILLGLVTYLTHGLLNSYSEQDKIAVLFWGFIAMITALDLYHQNPEELEEN
ncbi:MAG: O-antigen ligase family protein [Bacteroidia bacterium]|nr:O-antigen ligase family protein [Bacteroidia bacterium]MCF8427631.1 O-antigen ligase family protein [Bacteroidia bacterium]MCF8447644.1 O-antigen ligase family protein [Bacteroidia bacterium]